jgi:hypothetical protein
MYWAADIWDGRRGKRWDGWRLAVGGVQWRSTIGVHRPPTCRRHLRTVPWRLHRMAGLACFLSAKTHSTGTRLTYGGIRRRPDEQGDPCKQQTMSDTLVAATDHRSRRCRRCRLTRATSIPARHTLGGIFWEKTATQRISPTLPALRSD